MARNVTGHRAAATTDNLANENPFVQGSHFHIDIPENDRVIEPDDLSLDLLNDIDAPDLNGRTPHEGNSWVTVGND
jgi:hypothetical protein